MQAITEFFFKLNVDEAAISLLKEMGPSGIETELRSLSVDGGGSVEVMQSFLKMIGVMLDRKRDFELAQAYLALFLKVSVMEECFWSCCVCSSAVQ